MFREAWIRFRRPGRLIAVGVAALLIVLLGLLPALGGRGTCMAGEAEHACPVDPIGPDGDEVADQFYFAHQSLRTDGSITVRVASMTGIITYPPPNHDEIVPGLVPWAKVGVIVKDGTDPGSPYAALMMTGGHGVRMQYDYKNDIAGSAAAPDTPHWLRLTRTTITELTGYESVDGQTWTKVGAIRIQGFDGIVQIGLFATSPSDLSRESFGTAASRFTQASGTFDNITVDGATDGGWQAESVGEMGVTDWEKLHRPPGLVQDGETLTVTGSGDIGPQGTLGARSVESNLIGLIVALGVLIVVAVRFARGGTRREIVGQALVLGAVTFVAGLIASAVVLVAGTAISRGNGVNVTEVGAFTEARVIVGAAVLLTLVTVFAFALRVWLRRTWVALLVAYPVVVVSYLFGVVPFLPDAVSQWLLRVTPAAGFAVLQTAHEYPQVIALYVPSSGYYPLSGWAGLAVLCGYTVLAGWLALRRIPAARRVV